MADGASRDRDDRCMAWADACSGTLNATTSSSIVKPPDRDALQLHTKLPVSHVLQHAIKE
jgi:hypothetical protein